MTDSVLGKSEELAPGDILCSGNREAGCLLVPVFVGLWLRFEKPEQ